MSDKDPVTTVHEHDYFHGGIRVEISSTPAKDGVTVARLSFSAGNVFMPIMVDIPIIDVDFLQKLSDMALRAKAALAPLKLDPDKKEPWDL